MGYRLLVQDGAYPHLRFMGEHSAGVRRNWRCLDLESVNDNDPDRHDPDRHDLDRHDLARHDLDRRAEMERVGASVLGGGSE